MLLAFLHTKKRELCLRSSLDILLILKDKEQQGITKRHLMVIRCRLNIKGGSLLFLGQCCIVNENIFTR